MTVSKQYANAGGHRDDKISTTDFDEIKEYIPSFSEKYRGKFIIQYDELKYTKSIDEKEKEYVQSLNINKELLIPIEYRQVEYLESTGTQWIDTKIEGNSVNELYCGLDIVKMINGNWANIMSVNIDELSLGTDMSTSRVYTRINWAYNYPANITNGVCNDFIINKTNVKCNGNIVQTYNVTKLNSNSSGHIFLFNTNSKSRGSASRIYYLKIVDDSTFSLSINLIPCYSTTTVTDVNGKQCPAGTIGMYDLVTGKFFTNQGTGEFIAGPDVD